MRHWLTATVALALLGCVLADVPPEKCVPFNGGKTNEGYLAGYNSLQDYCQSLMQMPDKKFDDMFKAAPKPRMDFTEGFGLKGCIYGCMVGNQTRGAWDYLWRTVYRNFGGGVFWNGDCYHGYNETNQIFPTKITLYISPFQGAKALPWGSRLGNSLNVPVPFINGTLKYLRESWWDQQPVYTMRFKFPMTDEMRQLYPGAMIGKSSFDPTFGRRQVGRPNGPLMSNFIFFQVCSKTNPDQYPFKMNDRAIF